MITHKYWSYEAKWTPFWDTDIRSITHIQRKNLEFTKVDLLLKINVHQGKITLCSRKKRLIFP